MKVKPNSFIGACILKRLIWLVFISLIIAVLAISVRASDPMAFNFDLTVDGKTEKQVEPGDVVTVVLRLKRTDSDGPYSMHGMQAELRYDSSFMELIENSAMVQTGVATADLAMVDYHREFYLNFLSMTGGTSWSSDTIVGSVQFRIIGSGGMAKLRNMDYLVSLPDGSGSYVSSANDVVIRISDECIVTFVSNGGSEVESELVTYGQRMKEPQKPTRAGYTFAGWYTDVELTKPWNFHEDVVDCNMTLYAQWTEGVAVVHNNAQMFPCWIILLLALLIATMGVWMYRNRKRTD